MSINLLETLKTGFGNSFVKHSADFLEEPEAKAGTAIDGTYAALLAGVIEKGSTEKGANGLMKIFKKADSNILDDVANIFTRSPQTVNGLMNAGTRDLPEILGSKQRLASNQVAEESGIKKVSSGRLMKLSSPFLMSTLGKHVTENNLDTKGLMSFLDGQKANVKSALTPEMIDKMELSSFGWVKKEPVVEKKVVKPKKVKKPKAKEVAEAKAAEKKAAAAAVVTEKASSGFGLWKWVLPLLLLIGAWFLFGMKKCNPAEKATSTVVKTTKAVAAKTTAAVEKTTKVVTNSLGNVNEAAKNALADIKFAKGSAGKQMMNFINGGAKGEGKFRFKNLNFASGSADIKGKSGVEADNLASILKAYPDLKVDIQGYTDNRGDATKNQALSQRRAETVKNRLVAAGIGVDRMTTQGFGDANPVADNETPKGRRQNRRIEVVLIK